MARPPTHPLRLPNCRSGPRLVATASLRCGLAAALLLAAGCPDDPDADDPSAGSLTAATAPDDTGTGLGDASSEDGPGSDPSAATQTEESGDPTATASDADDSDSDTTGEPCVPADEICDGIDDDCDGIVDDGDPGGGTPCDTAMAGACSAGETVCEGGALVCLALARSQPETCDGIDNDCDGEIDEGLAVGGPACNTGLPGECAGGIELCIDGALQCSPNVPVAETCNGLDDDCDGVVDEDCACAHDVCITGDPLAPGCDPCVDSICALDPFCCNTAWDGLCVGQIEGVCGLDCSPEPSCEHGLCETGAALSPECDPCVDSICAVDSFCCNTSWDAICVGRVETVCGQDTCVVPECAHPICSQGDALTPDCDPCVADICAVDAFCCDNAWDGLCVDQVTTVCGQQCSACVHPLCEPGAALTPDCDPCAAQICAGDAYCCNTAWDAVCVGQVESVCGQTCQ